MKAANLPPIKEHTAQDFRLERLERWELQTPYLVDFLVNADESEVHWPQRFRYRTPSRSEVARQELQRMSRVADEYAQRKHIAAALSVKDLTPLFDVWQGDPFFRQLAKLYQLADYEQRLALLEGLGPTLLERAHWKGWMQSFDVPKSSLSATDTAANGKVAEFCADYSEERKSAPSSQRGATAAKERSQSLQQTEVRRRKLSVASSDRSKEWAANEAGVNPGDYFTSREFRQRASLTYSQFNRVMRESKLLFEPLRGPKGAPLLWRKSDVLQFIALRARPNGRS